MVLVTSESQASQGVVGGNARFFGTITQAVKGERIVRDDDDKRYDNCTYYLCGWKLRL